MIKNSFLLIVILITGCNNLQHEKRIKTENTQRTDQFFTINFLTLLDNKTEVPISEITQDIKYIPLETSDKSILGSISDAKFTKDYIFIKPKGLTLLMQFNFEGKFIRYIGKIGKGPEEYDLIRAFSIDEESRLIYIQPNGIRHILVYSFEGDYIKTIKINRDENSIVWSRDSYLICYSKPYIGNEEYVFTEINFSGESMQAVNNYTKWKDPPPFGRSQSFPGQRNFYRLNNRLHFKSMYNDTIYTYDINKKIKPKFFVDLGKYKIPEDKIFERGLVKRIPANFFWTSINEASDYVFIYYSAYDSDDDMGQGVLKAGFAVYDKRKNFGKALINNNNEGKMILFSEIGDWGFKNDIDGGPEFIPEYSNDSLAYHFISSLSMKRFLKTDKFLKSKPKYPTRKIAFYEQMNKLKESDNEILMIVRLK